MKRLVFAICLATVTVFGCNEPIVLDGEEDLLEVDALTQEDPDVELTAIDSTAILPSDENTFAGLLVVNKVTYDVDDGPRVDSFALSRVFFADILRPVRHNQRTVGFHGFYLGGINLNTLPMIRIPHIIRMRMPPADTVAGFEYIKDLTATYRPNQAYTWAADSINVTGVSIVSPGELRVIAPTGGAVLSRNRSIELLWRGEGSLSIIISAYDPVLRRTRPLLRLRPRVNQGRAVLGVRLLRLLPPGRDFIFTFVLSNRRVEDVLRPYRGQVLLQASEVHNIFVKFP